MQQDDDQDNPYNYPTSLIIDSDPETRPANVDLGTMPYDILEADAFSTSEEYNHYVFSQVKVSLGENEVLSIVRKCKHYQQSNIVGVLNKTPLLYTWVYELDMPDGTVEEFSANLISYNYHSQ